VFVLISIVVLSRSKSRNAKPTRKTRRWWKADNSKSRRCELSSHGLRPQYTLCKLHLNSMLIVTICPVLKRNVARWLRKRDLWRRRADLRRPPWSLPLSDLIRFDDRTPFIRVASVVRANDVFRSWVVCGF